MTDPQLSMFVTDRINPQDQVTLMPGVDAVCGRLSERDKGMDTGTLAEEVPQDGRTGANGAARSPRSENCLWPFCPCFAPPTKEDE